MKCVALCALASGLALAAAGCGDAGQAQRTAIRPSPPPINIDRRLATSQGPLVPGPASLLTAPQPIDTGDGQIVSCVPGSHVWQLVDIRNRTASTLIVTGATGEPDQAPRILRRVATQIRLEPRPRPVTGGGVTYSRGWSTAPERQVAIPAGRSAIVQSNFRMGHCEDLAGGRTLVVPGDLLLTYRKAGKVVGQRIPELQSRLFVMQGAARHDCGPRITGGSSKVVAANVSCEVARQTALECRRPSFGGGTCKSDRRVWDCAGEVCWVQRDKAEWIMVITRRGL